MKTLLAAALFVLVTSMGCGPIDAAADCQSICSKYADCFDRDYDVSACAARCRSNSSSDAAYRRRANECDACIHERACASATFSCGLECASIVP